MEKIITGFHAIEESVLSLAKKKNDSQKFTVYYSKSGPRVKKILLAAKEQGVEVKNTDDAELNTLVKGLPVQLRDHRGIVLCVSGENERAENLVDFDAWLKSAADSEKKATVVILDSITDPYNAGAILRSCDQFGASLVIFPEHNSVRDVVSNEVVKRASAGASAWVPLCVVNNLARAVEKLKSAGFWIYGADAGGEKCDEVSFAQKAVIVMGSEGNGIAALLKKQCDTIVCVPTCGKIDSLNVSVAAGVLLYELFRRNKNEI